jgi:hypothetical protein
MIFLNLLFIITLFKLKGFVDFLSKLTETIFSSILSVLLLFGSVTLGALYHLTGNPNDENLISYNQLDQSFWAKGLGKRIKLSNDFQSLVYRSEGLFQTADSKEDGTIIGNGENISFTTSAHQEPNAYSDNLKKLHLSKLKWWRPLQVENSNQVPELVEVEAQSDLENINNMEEHSTKSEIENDGSKDIEINDQSSLAADGDTNLFQKSPHRKRSMFFKNSKLRVALNDKNQDTLQLYPKQVNFLKTSKSLLKFGPEDDQIDIVSQYHDEGNNKFVAVHQENVCLDP